MIVSAWSDGKGSVYGLRILGNGRSLYFREEWESIVLLFPDTQEPATVSITGSFWGACPVIRSRAIRAFLRRNGLTPWPRDHPPHFDLEPLGGGRFRLRWLEHRVLQPTLGLFEGAAGAAEDPGGAHDGTASRIEVGPAADGGDPP